MFEGCEGIKELDLTSFNFFKGEYFNDIFNYCENMTVWFNNDTKQISRFIEKIPDYVIVKYNSDDLIPYL